MNANNTEPTVFLVDDDASVVSALSRGLAANGFNVRSWTDAVTFLREHDPTVPGCLSAIWLPIALMRCVLPSPELL